MLQIDSLASAVHWLESRHDPGTSAWHLPSATLQKSPIGHALVAVHESGATDGGAAHRPAPPHSSPLATSQSRSVVQVPAAVDSQTPATHAWPPLHDFESAHGDLWTLIVAPHPALRTSAPMGISKAGHLMDRLSAAHLASLLWITPVGWPMGARVRCTYISVALQSRA